ncbi:MAG: hypothetical protein HYU36_23685 [Planctomycetes bacterium]|nr:hypothetical protein [Planctomycetota bacterium]
MKAGVPIVAVLALLHAGWLMPHPLLAEVHTDEGPMWRGEDVEITVMMEYISRFLNKRFVYDPSQLRGKKIAVLSNSRIPQDRVYGIFQSILQMYGFVLVEYDAYVRVEQAANARLLQTGVYSAQDAARFTDQDRLITRVFALQNADANTLSAVVQRMIHPQYEQVIAVVDSNTLVVTGFARNLERIASVVDASDRVGPDTVTEYVALKYARTDEVTKQLQPLVQGFVVRRNRLGTRATRIPPPQVIAVAANNGVILSATEGELQEMRSLLQRLDVPGPELKTEFVQLQHAFAEEVLKQIDPLLKTFAMERTKPGVKNGLAAVQIVADPRTNGLVLTGTPDELQAFRDLIAKLDVEVARLESIVRVFPVRNADAEEVAKVLEKVLKPSATAAGAAPGRPSAPAGAAVEAGSRNELGEIELIAQRGVVVVRASAGILERVEKLLAELDIRKPKVLIEAAIVELTVDGSFDIGVELATVHEPTQDPRPFGATNVGISQLLDTNNDGIPDARIPVAGAGIVAGIFKERVGNIPLLLKALESKARIRVLAAPMVVADDNQDATFKASDQVPVATFTTTQSTTDVTSFGGFQEAKIELKIKSSINQQDGYLRLDIKQTVEAFQGDAVAVNLPPRKISREVTAVVTVPNGRTVVVGGLNNNRLDKAVRGVPYLQRIPGLGVLFRGKTDRDVQTRLYAIVSPTIFADLSFEDYERMSRQRQAELDQFIQEDERRSGLRRKRESRNSGEKKAGEPAAGGEKKAGEPAAGGEKKAGEPAGAQPQ